MRATSPTVVRPSDPLVEIHAKLDVLLEKVTALEQGVLARQPVGPRDAADAALLVALLDVGSFQVDDVIDHGQLFPDFAAVLTAADIVTAVDLGYWLRRHRGHIVNGRRLEVVDRDNKGAVWAFVAR